MKKALFLLAVTSALVLVSCKPYQMDIPQGRSISAEQLSEIKVGMTKESVLLILGNPLQGNAPYDPNRLDYVSTMQKNGGPIDEKRLSIYFKNNIVVKIVQKEDLAIK